MASLRDRVREAVATLQPLKARCTDLEDGAYGEILLLEVFLARAERADGLALERLLRELSVDAHSGQQGSWSPTQACKDVKAELKSLKDAQARTSSVERRRRLDACATACAGSSTRTRPPSATARSWTTRTCCSRRATSWRARSRCAATSSAASTSS